MYLFHSYACAIPDTEDTVVLTGGVVTQATVSVYSLQGWQEDLPPLNTGECCWPLIGQYWSRDLNTGL